MAQVSGLATVERLKDEIQGVRYREATSTFCRLVTEEQKPLKQSVACAHASPA